MNISPKIPRFVQSFDYFPKEKIIPREKYWVKLIDYKNAVSIVVRASQQLTYLMIGWNNSSIIRVIRFDQTTDYFDKRLDSLTQEAPYIDGIIYIYSDRDIERRCLAKHYYSEPETKLSNLTYSSE